MSSSCKINNYKLEKESISGLVIRSIGKFKSKRALECRATPFISERTTRRSSWGSGASARMLRDNRREGTGGLTFFALLIYKCFRFRRVIKIEYITTVKHNKILHEIAQCTAKSRFSTTVCRLLLVTCSLTTV